MRTTPPSCLQIGNAVLPLEQLTSLIFFPQAQLPTAPALPARACPDIHHVNYMLHTCLLQATIDIKFLTASRLENSHDIFWLLARLQTRTWSAFAVALH